MSDLAIRAVGLSKRYKLGAREHYRALRDVITDGVKNAVGVLVLQVIAPDPRMDADFDQLTPQLESAAH